MPKEAYEAIEKLFDDIGDVELEYVAGYYNGESTKVDHDDRWYAVVAVDFGFGRLYTIIESEDVGVAIVGGGDGKEHVCRMAKSYSSRDEALKL